MKARSYTFDKAVHNDFFRKIQPQAGTHKFYMKQSVEKTGGVASEPDSTWAYVFGGLFCEGMGLHFLFCLKALPPALFLLVFGGCLFRLKAAEIRKAFRS